MTLYNQSTTIIVVCQEESINKPSQLIGRNGMVMVSPCSLDRNMYLVDIYSYILPSLIVGSSESIKRQNIELYQGTQEIWYKPTVCIFSDRCALLQFLYISVFTS
jgi:hypothetical protein